MFAVLGGHNSNEYFHDVWLGSAEGAVVGSTAHRSKSHCVLWVCSCVFLLRVCVTSPVPE